VTELERELAKGGGTAIVYDGDCPFCRAYVTMTEITNAGPTLVNARERPDLVRTLAQSGIDLDSGMAVYYQGRIYTGGEAMHLLALLSRPSGLVEKLASALLRRRRFALLVYPALRLGRNLLLKLRNRPPLSNAP
jgi:predicted DCC family thiol-disulfide oxidoreductase YuxK